MKENIERNVWIDKETRNFDGQELKGKREIKRYQLNSEREIKYIEGMGELKRDTERIKRMRIR